MAPEYAIDGNFSVKSDVFSFDILLLEIVPGKKNKGYMYQKFKIMQNGMANGSVLYKLI